MAGTTVYIQSSLTGNLAMERKIPRAVDIEVNRDFYI
jgi:hypothetical protein